MADQQKESSSIDDIDKIKGNYLKFFEDWLSSTGINPFIARIMQLLRTENRALTQKEMTELLGLSTSTISRNLKVMEQLELLKITPIPTEEKVSFVTYQYELRENSLFYIINTFITRTYASFKQRIDDNKGIFNQILKLPDQYQKRPDIENLIRIIKEEAVVFDTMKGKFEELLQELEIDMSKAKNKEK